MNGGTATTSRPEAADALRNAWRRIIRSMLFRKLMRILRVKRYHRKRR